METRAVEKNLQTITNRMYEDRCQSWKEKVDDC